MSLTMSYIDKSFGAKNVLHGFSLSVADGERVCLLGPSGGGKSTLLRIIAGLVRPDRGTVSCDFARLGYVFQEDRLLPWLTAEENITAAAGCTRDKARELLDAMELGGERNAYPDSLSGGMRQRVNIARALARDPDLLLLDEPFKGLDKALRERMICKINAYAVGCAVLLVTHDSSECEWMGCTKIIEFR